MRITCHIPIAVRVAGEPTRAQLETLRHAVARSVAERLAKAEQVMAERQRGVATMAPPVRERYEADRDSAASYAIPSYQDDGDLVDVQARPTNASRPEPRAQAGSADAVDAVFDWLQRGKAALVLAHHLHQGEPLSSDELYELLLIRRAEPLSIPASVVNTAGEAIKQLDQKVVTITKTIAQVSEDLGAAAKQRASAKGSARDVIALRIRQLKGQAKALTSERKRLLAEKAKLTRGRALGTPGAGAPAGTGQITYAIVQVVDARGRRIALETAETSATQHAEERILARLRATFKPDQLKGARLTVMTDQKVCGRRCRPAFAAFAREFGVELVESKLRVRPAIGKPGAASPRTTLRTTTMPSSAGLPVSEHTEEIYRRPGTPAAPSTVAGHQGAAGPKGGAPATARPAQPDVPSRRPTTATGPPPLPPGTRTRTALGQAGGMLIIDLVLDLVLMKFQQWRNDARLRKRLEALQPAIQVKKEEALEDLRHDPWAGGTGGYYYNVYLRIRSTTTVAAGGGRGVVFPGSPRPEVVGVKTSRDNVNKLLSEDEAAQVVGLAEGATGAVVRVTDTQFVVYSQPVEQDQ